MCFATHGSFRSILKGNTLFVERKQREKKVRATENTLNWRLARWMDDLDFRDEI